MKNNENHVPNHVKLVSDFTSMLGFSAILQPFITSSIIATTKKSLDVDYKTSAKEILSMSGESFISHATRTLKRRAVSAILPATLSSQIADKYQLSNIENAAANTAFESLVSGLILREASERFNAANMQKFSILAADKSAKDLTKLSREDFFINARNHQISESYGEKDWQELKRRQTNYHNNLPFQSASLLVRNASFSASVFLTKPLAQSIYQSNREEFQNLGVNQSTAELALNNSFRAALAWVTTPFDKIFTQLSSGEKSASEVLSSLSRDVKTQNLSSLFKGSSARICLCLLTASSISEGLDFSKKLLKLVEENDLFKGIFYGSEFKEMPKIEILKEAPNIELRDVSMIINPTQANLALDKMKFNSIISSFTENDLKQSIEKSASSIDLFRKNISELFASFSSEFCKKPSTTFIPSANPEKISKNSTKSQNH